MIVTIQLSPEVEAQLRDCVARRDAEAMRQFLVTAVAPTVDELLHQPEQELSDEEFDKLSDELADFNAPPLSDYAISREGIYGDHP